LFVSFSKWLPSSPRTNSSSPRTNSSSPRTNSPDTLPDTRAHRNLPTCPFFARLRVCAPGARP
jgi:hypothetical protein